MKIRGSSFSEYAIILGVVSAVFMGMNTYIKRGLQGRLKEMTDFFIGREQVVEISPTAKTSVNTDSKSSVNEDRQLNFGGGSGIHLRSTTHIAVTTHVEDFTVPAPPGSEGFINAERGQVTPPPPPTQQQ